MSLAVFIDGAAGTTGLEIADRLAGRSEFELITLDAARRKDPTARREALNAADIAILCLPDDAARDAVKLIDPNGRTRVIDASSAHRVAAGWTYGFPELIGGECIAEARRVSNPGCYPTGFLALLVPLLRAGLLSANWPYTVNAVSGYSGGGKALIARFEMETDIAYRAYGLTMGHKHLAEMQTVAELRHAPVFSPAVVPAMRGMIVDVPLPRDALPGCPPATELRTGLAEYYRDAMLIDCSSDVAASELLLLADVEGWDGMELFVFADADSTQIRLVARLDNLGKGASGAAVQSLNLMAGCDEYAGLSIGNPYHAT
jgi:N-acetyl-gamma-glutamyl-phosphate reductase